MHYVYHTKNTCSTEIAFDLQDNVVHNVQFTGGCNGNLKAVSRLVEGLPADQVIAKCSGIECGRKTTSCADQLAHAVRQAVQTAP